ncbi:universal stress protein [Nocardioides marmoraquaticus]
MTLVVAHPPHKEDRAALHLAASLARAAKTDLRLVSVVPAPWPTPVAGGPDKEYARWSREYGEQAVAAATAALAEHCPDVEASATVRSGSSVAAALIDEAGDASAAMIVMGSGSDGSWGRVVLSSTADRLLHSSPVPVAVAPRGFRAEPGARTFRATCAFRGDRASEAVLERAAKICKGIDAELRVVTFAVRGRTMYPPEVLGEADVLDAYLEETARRQERAVAGLSDPPNLVDTAVVSGRTWAEALEQVDWHPDDVLVVGSSSASLMSRLFLGSNATKIVRHSPVPVVVVP